MKVAAATEALYQAEKLLGQAMQIILQNPAGVLDTASSVLGDGDWREAAASLIQSNLNYCESVKNALPYGTAGDDVPDGLDAKVTDAVEKCGKALKLVDDATNAQYGLSDALAEVSAKLAASLAEALEQIAKAGGKVGAGLFEGLLSSPLVLVLVGGFIWWRYLK